MTRILVLGAGNVGRALGLGWLGQGHDVRFGVPDPSKAKYEGIPADRLQAADSLGDAEVVVVTTPSTAARQAVAVLGDLTGRTIIDCTNAVGHGAGGMTWAPPLEGSVAEQIAAVARGAAVFKSFNQTGAENMVHSASFPQRPVMFVAGDDGAKKPLVMQLVSEIGFEAIDAGPLIAARLLEPMALLWINLAFRPGGTRDFAFSLVRRT
jgi:predicted dinucleotide-binding enzyme